MFRTAIVAAILLISLPLTGAERLKVSVTSTLDGTSQPCYVILPTRYLRRPQPLPLLVSLHSWSAGLEQRNKPLEAEAERLGWIYLFPHFRGPNQHPDACGSLKAQQDILDALDWACKKYQVEMQRIYLAGVSGGGHMTMLMAGRHPQRWTAASAWVGISDLAAWHNKHSGDRYGAMMRASCGGAPGSSQKVDAEYRARSPLTWLDRSLPVPLDIAAGVHDGHSGSVPVAHSLRAFNMIARAAGSQQITAGEMDQIGRENGRLEQPTKDDRIKDASFGRKIYLRRHAGRSRVTIFEGGHEGNARATTAWLEQFHKAPASQPSPKQ